MKHKWLILFILLISMLVRQRSVCLACSELIYVNGYRPGPDSRGAFVSENFPHALPFHSRCTYEFRIYYSYYDSTNALCIQFQEMELFTAEASSSNDESIMEIRSERLADPLLTYSGSGYLLREADNTKGFVVSRPENLLNGSLCLAIRVHSNSMEYFVTVINNNFERNMNNRLTRFFASYLTADTTSPDWKPNFPWNGARFKRQHRCLDQTYIDRSNCCNSINDCQNKFSNGSDFLDGLSSDESYEHARCNSVLSFGTNFALGQASAHRLQNGQLDCNMDHSRLFNSLSHARDCSAKLQLDPANSLKPVLKFSGLLAAAKPQSPTCYRFFWFSSGFNNDEDALTLAEPNGGRVLLRLPARWRFYTWSRAEVQVEPGFAWSWIDLYAVPAKRHNRTLGAHWLDDLSAEPAACNESTYERHLPSICSFEWSTCGWETLGLPVVSDKSIATEFGVSITDHTSISVPDRRLPRLAQKMLYLKPFNETARLEATRGLPFGSSWCFDIWLYGLGDADYSFSVDIFIEPVSELHSKKFLTLTMPNNQWRLLSGTIKVSSSRHPTMRISLRAKSALNGTRAVLLDDLGLIGDECFREFETNSTAECGRIERLCSNKQQCILVSQVCDGRFDCIDKSDEVNCYENPAPNWAVILPVGAAVLLLALLILGSMAACRRRRSRSAASEVAENSDTQLVERSRVQLPTYEEATMGLPKYEDLQHC